MALNKSVPERITLLEHRMDHAEESGREYRKSLKELSGTLDRLSHNMNQIKWVVIGAVVATSGPAGFSMVTKLFGV